MPNLDTRTAEPDRKPKVFCVGCNKTGTKSLKVAMEDLGYRFGDDRVAARMAADLWPRRDFRALIEYCETAEAFSYLAGRTEEYDMIIPEQELNHLTLDEQIDFLKMCHTALKPGGRVVVYGLNGANPMVGAENLAHNIDHFNTFTEYSLGQVLELAGFSGIKVHPLKLYVFWKNPLNYVGLAITSVYELYCRIMFKLYGKNVKVLSKKLAAVASR